MKKKFFSEIAILKLAISEKTLAMLKPTLFQTKAIELRLKIKGAINQVLVEHSPQFSRQCSDLETSGSSLEDKEESAKLEMHLAFLRREFVNHVNNIENGLDSHVTGVKSLMDEKLSWRQHFVSQKQLIIERQRQALNLIAEHIKRFLETQIRFVNRVENIISSLISLKNATYLRSQFNNRYNS